MEENKLFPAKSDYRGPTAGWFSCLHHHLLVEYSNNVIERIEYIKREKPKNEVAIRLKNILCLDEIAEVCETYYPAMKAASDAHVAALKIARDVYVAAIKEPGDAYYVAFKLVGRAHNAALKAASDAYGRAMKPARDAYAAAVKLAKDAYAAAVNEINKPLLEFIARYLPNHDWNGHELKFTDTK